MFNVGNLFGTLWPLAAGIAVAFGCGCRPPGIEPALLPLFDGRKAGAGAARSPREDGAATASSSPRPVIRGESPPVGGLVAADGKAGGRLEVPRAA